MAATATVACKLPNGITIDHKGITVTFKGANDPAAVMGFGLTHNVDAAWFKSLAETDFKDFAPIKNGSLFIATNPAAAVDMVEERKDDASVQTGMEPLDPEKPGKGLEPTDDQKKELEKLPPTDNKAKG